MNTVDIQNTFFSLHIQWGMRAQIKLCLIQVLYHLSNRLIWTKDRKKNLEKKLKCDDENDKKINEIK